MNKKISFLIRLILVVALLVFVIGFGNLVHHKAQGGEKFGALGDVAVDLALLPATVKDTINHFLGRYPVLASVNTVEGLDGFELNGQIQQGAIADTGFLLVSVFDGELNRSVVRLIRISDQKLMHQWLPDVAAISSQQSSRSRYHNDETMNAPLYRPFNPAIMDDGGLVFHNNGPLVRTDVCGVPQWVNSDLFHHSIERDHEGHFWVPSVIESQEYDEYLSGPYRNDAISKISAEGETLYIKSVADILRQNGYEYLLFGIGEINATKNQLKDIQPALYSGEYWQQGDLLVSMSHLSTVFLYRPSNNKILWLKTGPWMKQYDVNFVGQSSVSVFGNDSIAVPNGPMRGDLKHVSINGHNEAYLYDLNTKAMSKPYHDALKAANVNTFTGGKHKRLSNGDLFIEEQGNGRILRLSGEGVVWQYNHKYSQYLNGITNWSRYYSAEKIAPILRSIEGAKCD